MSKWATILRIGRKAVDNPATRSLGRAVTSPAKTLNTAGSAVKNAAVGAGVGYVGWQALVNDKPVVRTVADVAIGPENVDAVVDATSNVVDKAGELVRDTGEAISNVAEGAKQSTSMLGGISDFMQNMTEGHGGDMFSNLFSNIFKGNVSGLGIAGLLAAGLMIFGRTGFLGKIAGVLLAMMLIGNNSRLAQAPATAQVTPEQPSGGMRR